MSAAVDFPLRARTPVPSVWHPYHFHAPTVAGCDGPVGVALAEVLDVDEAVLLVDEAPEHGVLPVKAPHVPDNSLAALKASTTRSAPLPLRTSSLAVKLWPPGML